MDYLQPSIVSRILIMQIKKDKEYFFFNYIILICN